ncbi:Cytoplasmic aconitate hydratase [Amphibalanus amphitrite]|uniref:Cytoplasmic aconitate hydratase n=1 Tax=Amphibalanus amphitrite TaxID=1232801 RepID=A0A6A4VZV6_AMPAM|nr:Cytoplasmic aconitate hydratase [Amphibalanus amphitrite]
MENSSAPHPYQHLEQELVVDGATFRYLDLAGLNDPRCERLPFSVRVLLEAAVRCCDGVQLQRADVEALLDWRRLTDAGQPVHVPFKPGRVILQDFTGVPAVVDLAAMREAVRDLGGDPARVGPICPADLVIDHSVQVDFSRARAAAATGGAGDKEKECSSRRDGQCACKKVDQLQLPACGVPAAPIKDEICPFHEEESAFSEALRKNQELEFDRNSERFQFLKWGSRAFANMRVVPPGSGIVHQVNLEYLARCQVVGYRITGQVNPLATAHRHRLTITKHLRQVGVAGKFVELFGPGVSQLSIADRATISNMCPEYGATVGFFPVDERSLDYLVQTELVSLSDPPLISMLFPFVGREADLVPVGTRAAVAVMRAYLSAAGLLRDYSAADQDPAFSQVVALDLATVVPFGQWAQAAARRVAAKPAEERLHSGVCRPRWATRVSACPRSGWRRGATFQFEGATYSLGHGSVVIAAITSCTKHQQSERHAGAGILAKKAVERGLSVPPWIKTSLSPGSAWSPLPAGQRRAAVPAAARLWHRRLRLHDLYRQQRPLPRPVWMLSSRYGRGRSVQGGLCNLVCCGVLSGNRNFEGRVHPHVRANYLASPPLVIAYALAGRVDIDLENDAHRAPGTSPNGEPVYLGDIWPTREEIHQLESKSVIPAIFADVYSKNHQRYDDRLMFVTPSWNALEVPDSATFQWSDRSTYIQMPTFLQGMTRVRDGAELNPPAGRGIEAARALLCSVTPSPPTTSHQRAASHAPARPPATSSRWGDSNSYGSRRGNEAVMVRGTYANIRLANGLLAAPGPRTVHLPSGAVLDVFDAAQRYRRDGTAAHSAGRAEYGCGSSRDWAAKGPALLSQSRRTTAAVSRWTARLETQTEISWYRHGGLLRYMVRQLL